MELELKNIKNEVQATKKKGGNVKHFSQEDMHMMACIQPACHTQAFCNEYFLTSKVDYDGCICCEDLPDGKMPMTIVPIIDPACFGFQPPGGWAPMEYGEATFNVHKNDHIETEIVHYINGHKQGDHSKVNLSHIMVGH